MITPKARGYYKSTVRLTSATDSTTVWQAGTERPLNDYRAMTTTILPDSGGVGANESTLIFGNWRDLVRGLWSNVDLLVDDITLGDSGGIVLRAFQDIDVGLRHVESFAFVEDAILE